MLYTMTIIVYMIVISKNKLLSLEESHLFQDDTLWFFNDQLCQSMPLVFDKEITSVEIPGYRFIPRADVFTTPRTTPENDCFCADEPLCDMIGDGMFVVAKCQMEAPIILSWPHFLHANSSFQRSVHGLKPDKEKHGFHFDIQQVSYLVKVKT